MHGFDLSPADHRLLRGRPPARALRWCAAAAGGEVVAVRAIEGGSSSAVHAVDVRVRGQVRPLVLRRYVRSEWLAEEPDLASREATALELVRELPAPRLVAADAAGAAADVPAVLMTRLDGALDWAPDLRRLAALLARIHAVRAPDGGLPPYRPYALKTTRPPAWSKRPDVWRRAFEVFRGPAPAGEPCFIHRDFHPGNVLWSGGAVSGIVDWANASLGPPGADIGHCRMNLAGTQGLAAADRFLALTGRAGYDPYWDVVAVLGGFEEADWDAADEAFLAAAVSRLRD